MKKVLITGTSSGFGKGLVETFSENGYCVIATMRDSEERGNLFKHINTQNIHILELDVRKSIDRKRVKDYIEKNLEGSIDLLINNAAYAHYGALEDATEDQIRNQFEVNTIAPILLIKDFLPFLRKSKQSPKIINISSLIGIFSVPLGSLYSSSKFALCGVSEGLAFELQSQGIQVCTVCPGEYRTNFTRNIIWSKNRNNSHYKRDYDFLDRTIQKLSSQKNGKSPREVVDKVFSLSRRKKIPSQITIGFDSSALSYLLRVFGKNFFYMLFLRLYKKLSQ